jgi:hypothetical protein
MRSYGLESEKTQAGHGNENGDVEQRHHRFKRAVAQELMLRGSTAFASVDAYKSFLAAADRSRWPCGGRRDDGQRDMTDSGS